MRIEKVICLNVLFVFNEKNSLKIKRADTQDFDYYYCV